MANYLVTGATGYLGRKLTGVLTENGDKVYVLVREISTATFKNEITQIKISNSPEEFVRSIPLGLDAVFHLAAAINFEKDGKDIVDIIDANLRFPTLLLHAMKENAICRFINIGTYWQAMSVDSEVANTIYGASKSALEPIIDYYSKFHNINTISIRLPDVYGEDDCRLKLLTLLKNAPAFSEFDLTGGEQCIFPLHVDDVVSAVILACNRLMEPNHLASHKRYSIFGKSLTLRQFVQLFCSINELKLHLNWHAKPYADSQIFSPLNLDVLPNWEQKITLDQGLRRYRR